MKLTTDLVVSKWFSLKPYEKADEQKTFKLELTIPNGTTIMEMATSILATYVIKWQNASRSKWNKLVDKSTIKLTFKKPITSIDPLDAITSDALADGIDITDTDALTVYIMERLTKQ